VYLRLLFDSTNIKTHKLTNPDHIFICLNDMYGD